MKNEIIIVLGMHRSGTSALTGSLSRLGFEFGDNLQGAMANVNEKGFFEDNDVVALNERILITIGRSWASLAPIKETEFLNPLVEELLVEAVLLVEKKMVKFSRLALKDPRLCVLMPFWVRVFAQLHIAPKILVAVRNPVSVVDSLVKRDSFEREKAYYLWLKYVVSSLELSERYDRVFVDYDGFIENQKEGLERISEELSLSATTLRDDNLSDGGFIEKTLRHSKFESRYWQIDTSCPPIAGKLYELLHLICDAKANPHKRELDLLLKEANQHLVDGHQLLRLAAKQDSELSFLRGQIIESDKLQEINSQQHLTILAQKGENEETQRVCDFQHLKIEELTATNDFQHSKIEKLQKFIEIEEAVGHERDKEIQKLSLNHQNAFETISLLEQTNIQLVDEAIAQTQRLSEYGDEVRGLFDIKSKLVSQLEDNEHELSDLRQELANFQNSTIWKISLPLRYLVHTAKRAIRLGQIRKAYLHANRGLRSIILLPKKAYYSVSEGGFGGLKGDIVKYLNRKELGDDTVSTVVSDQDDNYLDSEVFEEQISSDEDATSILTQLPVAPTSVLEPSGMLVLSKDKPFMESALSLMVHVHAYHEDLIQEIRHYLDKIPQNFDLFITTDSETKKNSIMRELYGLGRVGRSECRIVVNRGRDIFPLFSGVRDLIDDYDLILHLHTKKSVHNSDLRGWRKFLLEALVGNEKNISSILGAFNNDPELGVLYPHPYHPILPFMRLGANEQLIRKVLSRTHNNEDEFDSLIHSDFPAGFMFWMRVDACRSIFDASFGPEEYAEEEGQSDGTLAHALERVIPFVAHASGFKTFAFLPEELYFGRSLGLAPISSVVNYCATQQPVVVLFDHFMGGGAKEYSRQIEKAHLRMGVNVVRVYYKPNNWILQWISDDGGMFFGAENLSELFVALSEFKVNLAVVNSFNSYPLIDVFLQELQYFCEDAKAKLEFKVHDFHAICPSQHLSNDAERYCGLPEDEKICNKCLANNQAVDWTSSKEMNIRNWREPFQKLLDKTNTITVFDDTSRELLSKVFKTNHVESIYSVPHIDSYFQVTAKADLTGPLSIGLLGTMSTIKGEASVTTLCEWLDSTADQSKVTLIGQSVVPLPSRVAVHGEYLTEELESLIKKYNINVIFMATIVPETFSFTISEAMKLQLPIVCYNIGAQANRLKKYTFGKVIELDTPPEGVIQSLKEIHTKAIGKQQ